MNHHVHIHHAAMQQGGQQHHGRVNQMHPNNRIPPTGQPGMMNPGLSKMIVNGTSGLMNKHPPSLKQQQQPPTSYPNVMSATANIRRHPTSHNPGLAPTATASAAEIPTVSANGILLGSQPETTITPHRSSENVASSDSGSKEKTPMCLVNELARYNKVNVGW